MQSKSSYLDELAVDVAEKSIIRFEKWKDWLKEVEAKGYSDALLNKAQSEHIAAIKNHEEATERYMQAKLS